MTQIPIPEVTSTRAVLSLVFGVLGITGTCPCIGSILAVVLGAGDRSGVARAGVILGWVTILFWVLCAGAGVFILLLAALIDAAN